MFDTRSMTLEAIRAEDEYLSTHVTMTAYCANTRIPTQIIGVGDAVFPKPELLDYTTLLDMEEVEVLAYRRETVVAEKLEAAIVLGDRNSRIKDFFDLRYLAQSFVFDRKTLTETVRKTLANRKTPLPTDAPIALTIAYWENPMRTPQVRAFARRAGLEATVDSGREILETIRPFLLPLIDDIRKEQTSDGTSPPGGPWQ